MKIKIAPSILSADFSCLKEELRRLRSAGADLVHVDVMDGHFVPNITIGPVVIKDMRRSTPLPLDVHLMIEDPGKYLESFVRAGSDMITVHIETVTPAGLRQMKRMLSRHKVKLGISLNPEVGLRRLVPVLGFVDFVLVMSVNPGFAGQEFIESVVPKIRELRERFSKDIAVDGGINDVTARTAVDAGANVLVAGSYIFKSGNYAAAIRRLRCVTG
jgi:ribulose-phosphate 3-epimerase